MRGSFISAVVPSVGSHGGRLERGGLIVRHADPQDGRRTRVSLSSEGRRNLYGNRAKREEWLVRAMHACLDESERALLAAAGPLLTRLAQFEEP